MGAMPSARDIRSLFKGKAASTGRPRLPGRTYAPEEWLRALHTHQQGLCASCQYPLDKQGYSIDVDDEGHVRGLLCHACKQAVTWVSRSERRAAGVLKYLMDGVPGREALPISRVRIARRPAGAPVVAIVDADGTASEPDEAAYPSSLPG
jgi:hypothetical protein